MNFCIFKTKCIGRFVIFVLSLVSRHLVELLFSFFYFSHLFYMCIGYDFRYKYPILEITTKKKNYTSYSLNILLIFSKIIYSQVLKGRRGINLNNNIFIIFFLQKKKNTYFILLIFHMLVT